MYIHLQIITYMRRKIYSQLLSPRKKYQSSQDALTYNKSAKKMRNILQDKRYQPKMKVKNFRREKAGFKNRKWGEIAVIRC